MSEYLITCVRKEARTGSDHHHIISVGIGAQRYTIADIYRFMDEGNTFRTASPSSGTEAPVAKYHCPCGVDTLRSHSDSYWDNNLDNLPTCK